MADRTKGSEPEQRNAPASATKLLARLGDAERYRLLVGSIADYAIYLLDPTGIVSSWNPGAQRFKGYKAEEIIGQHFSKFYTAEDRASGLPGIALETAAREGRFEKEGWRIRKDGTRFWAHVVIDAIRAPDGDLVGFAKITRDLTERKIAQEALYRSEERFKLLVQSVTDYAIYMIDPDGYVTNWNLGAERIKGYRPEEIIGQHFSKFYTEEDRAAGLPARALESAARQGRFEKEGWRVRKDGTRFWANVVLDPIRSAEGDILGFAKVTRDMSERRAAQQAIEQAREAFFQSQKMEALGQLTGGVAHDFNNLLMAIMGSIELAKKRVPDDPKIHRLLDNAMQGAHRGATLTRRMLSFARRQDMTPEPVDVPDLVRGMADLLERSAGPSVHIETRFPLGLEAVQTDPNQLELVLLNLTVNARDAMPDGGTVTIGARRETVEANDRRGLGAGRYVCVTVSDTGIGMDAETLAKATEPFFTTKGVGKGTGLGLSMVHGMAEQSGGRLLLTSELGKGTTAEVWLPVASAPVKARAEAPAAAAEVVGPLARRTIMAVDDDNLVLINTAAMLEDLGYEVVQAGSGEEALDLLREHRIDLVITDQVMPGMTGLKLAEAIAAEWPNLPVVLATGYAEMPEGITLPRLGKPFSQKELSAIVVSALRAEPERTLS